MRLPVFIQNTVDKSNEQGGTSMSILKKNNGPMSKGPSIQSISGDHWSELKFTDGIMTDAILKHVMGLC